MKNNYIEKTLSNGIKVYFYKDKNCKRTYVSYNVNYGTHGYYDKFYYKERPYLMQPAIAHFIEHYLIEHSQYGNILHLFNKKNYEFNGLTYPELTSYYFLGIDQIEESLREMIKAIDEPIFSKENIEIVKSAIIEELKNVSDNKYRTAISSNRNNLSIAYDEVPIENNVLGSSQSTKAITYDDVVAAYNAYYNDENKFLVICGNINIEKTLDVLERIYAEIKPHPNEMREFDYEDNFALRKDREVIEMRGDSDFVIITYKEKNSFKVSNIKQSLCLNIFYKLKSISLQEKFDKLVKDKVIIGGMQFDVDFFKDRIAIRFTAESYDPEKFEQFIKDNLIIENFSEKDFKQVKKQLIVNELKSRDYIYSCFKRFPTTISFTKNFDEIELISSLTLDDIKSVVSQYKFDLKTVTIVTNKKN